LREGEIGTAFFAGTGRLSRDAVSYRIDVEIWDLL
jgi:hypothetical protein